jgi:hypothetical protein
MATTRQACLVTVRGDPGAGKTALCATVSEVLWAMGVDAGYITEALWLRAILAVARELARQELGNRPEKKLFQYAARQYTGARLVQAASDMRLFVYEGNAFTKVGGLQPADGDMVEQIAGVWAHDDDVRQYITGDISRHITQAPGRTCIIDSSRGSVDFGHLRRRHLSIYLTVDDDEIAAARKDWTVEQLRARKRADLCTPAAWLVAPRSSDIVKDTSMMSEREVTSWLLQQLLRPLRPCRISTGPPE